LENQIEEIKIETEQIEIKFQDEMKDVILKDEIHSFVKRRKNLASVKVDQRIKKPFVVEWCVLRKQ